MVLFLRNKRFNLNIFIFDYKLGGEDYQLRSAHAAKHVWVAVITNWGLLPPPSHISYSTHYVFTQLINDCAFVNLRRSSKLLWSNLDYFKLNLLCWIIIILTSWSQHPLWALNLRNKSLRFSYPFRVRLPCRISNKDSINLQIN